MTKGARRLPSCAALGLAALLNFSGTVVAQPGDAKDYVQFVEDNDANCVRWLGKMVFVKSSHPTRTVRVWLDRYHMGKGTGDRSRSVLAPGSEPEKLGCSQTEYGTQEWRVVRARFEE